MQRNNRNFLLATAVVASLAIGGQASAQVIRITNANNHEIPLKAGSSVQIDSNGNLLAECALNASSACAALSTGGPVQGAPTLSIFDRNDGDSDIRFGDTIRLRWTSTLGEVCKASSTGPTATTWSGARTASNSVGEAIVAPALAGNYNFTMVCYNAVGASTVGSVTVAVAAPDGNGGNEQPSNDCTLTAAEPLYQPAGWAKSTISFAQAFTPRDGSPVPVYPNSNGFPVPIGTNKGSWLAVEFTAQANQSVTMFWDPAQANPIEGYNTARPASGMFIGISPCPGDVRPANDSGGFLMRGCRKYSNTGSLIFTTATALPASSVSACKLEPGKKYYINVMPADPTDGLQNGEHSCSDTASSSLGCDVQARTTSMFAN